MIGLFTIYTFINIISSFKILYQSLYGSFNVVEYPRNNQNDDNGDLYEKIDTPENNIRDSGIIFIFDYVNLCI